MTKRKNKRAPVMRNPWKSISPALQDFAKRLPTFEKHRRRIGGGIVASDTLFMYGDDFYIVEARDGRFYAAVNFFDDSDDADDEEIAPTLIDHGDHHGTYFTTVEDAVAAIHVWNAAGVADNI